jgi:hypothetical protein
MLAGLPNNESLWLWVPAFAGDDVDSGTVLASFRSWPITAADESEPRCASQFR